MADSDFEMEDLNNDCLMLILSNLNITDRIKCERVNRRWNQLILEVNHRQTSLALMPYPLRKVSDNYCLDMFVAQVFGIREADVMGTGWYSINHLVNDTLNKIMNRFPKITHLEIMELSPQLLEILDTNHRNLEAVCFHSVSQDLEVTHVVSRKNLRSSIKILAAGVSVTNHWIQLLVSEAIFPHLEEFYCISSEHGIETYYNSITLDIFVSVGPNFRKLFLGNRYLTGVTHQDSEKCELIKDSQLKMIKEFEAVGCLQETSHFFFDQVSLFSNLQTLRLNCLHLNPSDVQLEKMKQLKMIRNLSLILSPESSSCFMGICNNLRNMKKLTLRGPDLILSHQDFRRILISCPSLHYLHLQTLKVCDAVRYSTDTSSLNNLFTQIQKMKHLRLPFSDLKTSHVQNILTFNPELTCIDFNYCQFLDPNVVPLFRDYATRHRNRMIEVYLCQTETCFRRIADDLPSNLRLCGCSCDVSKNSFPQTMNPNHVPEV